MTLNPSRIIDMASAFYDSCVLFTASDLNIFGKLQELKSAPASTLAKELDPNPQQDVISRRVHICPGCIDNQGQGSFSEANAVSFVGPKALRGQVDRAKRDRYSK